MLLVTYDISNTKLRTQFSKMLLKYGNRIQFSVFEIRNSKRILNNILLEIDKNFKKKFKGTDSILIVPVCETCKFKRVKLGYAATEESDIIYL